jgi:hypothetical protein
MKVLNSNNLPVNYRRVFYSLNDNGRYLKEPSRIAFTTLPEYLKVETTRTAAPIKNGAETVIHGPTKKGKYTFYTGLRETNVLNWQYGNNSEIRNGRKSYSLVLFHWIENDRGLLVYYFTGWYHHDRERLEKLIPLIIEKVLQHETAE